MPSASLTHSAGCAPGAKLASAVVIEGGRVLARILGGMDWAIGQGVRILSMSLGVPGYEPAFEIVVEALRANGVLPVIAVGNDGPGAARSPGDYSHVLSVGAIDSGDRVASFSSSRRFARQDDPLVPDLIAPGVKVVSAVPSRAYASMSGTSMATPHVAGLAALLMEARPQATALQVETAILDSCALPPGVPPERGNRGVPDAVKALQLIESR